MKHIFFILIIFFSYSYTVVGQLDCVGELRIKNQKIGELEKFNTSLQRQNSELQTKLIICQGKDKEIKSDIDELPTCEPELKLLKNQIEMLRILIKEKDALIESKEKDINTRTIEVNTEKNKNKELESINFKLFKDFEKQKEELEEIKELNKITEKFYKDSLNKLLPIKKQYQILHDSLFLSIDFDNDIIHLDFKNEKDNDQELSDELIEVPFSIINSTDWTKNNIEYKLRRIMTLYMKYRDKLKIQLIYLPSDNQGHSKVIGNNIGKLIGRLNIYSSGLTNEKAFTLSYGQDIETKPNENMKKDIIKIALIKR